MSKEEKEAAVSLFIDTIGSFIQGKPITKCIDFMFDYNNDIQRCSREHGHPGMHVDSKGHSWSMPHYIERENCAKIAEDMGSPEIAKKIRE